MWTSLFGIKSIQYIFSISADTPIWCILNLRNSDMNLCNLFWKPDVVPTKQLGLLSDLGLVILIQSIQKHNFVVFWIQCNISRLEQWIEMFSTNKQTNLQRIEIFRICINYVRSKHHILWIKMIRWNIVTNERQFIY